MHYNLYKHAHFRRNKHRLYKKNCGELINYAVRILVKDGPTSIHR